MSKPNPLGSLMPVPDQVGGMIVDWIGLIPVVGDVVEVIDLIYPRPMIVNAQKTIQDSVTQVPLEILPDKPNPREFISQLPKPHDLLPPPTPADMANTGPRPPSPLDMSEALPKARDAILRPRDILPGMMEPPELVELYDSMVQTADVGINQKRFEEIDKKLDMLMGQGQGDMEIPGEGLSGPLMVREEYTDKDEAVALFKIAKESGKTPKMYQRGDMYIVEWKR